MLITQGQITYTFRGKEMAFDFYPVQPLERIGVSIRGDRTPLADGYRFTFTLIPSEEIVLKSVSIDISTDVSQHSRVFVNGFQSWTESREFDLRERIRNPRWPVSLFSKRNGDYTFYRSSGKPGVFHGWTYSYIRNPDGNITLFGSVSEDSGYTLFEFRTPENLLRVSRDCSGLELRDPYTALDILVLPGRENEVFDTYCREIHRRRHTQHSEEGHDAHVPTPASGWTSWHNHFNRISEHLILANLAELKKRDNPLDYFLIDDGWQRSVGDWLTPGPEFPKGMATLARAVRDAGYRPGIWLAPFVCARWSSAWRLHRDWLLRDGRGRPVRAGWNPQWGGPFYALDTRNGEFRDYLKRVFEAVREWGFELVKADFLYAAGMRPSGSETRGGVMAGAMDLLRELTRGQTLIAGGVPLGPAFGRADYCRVGANVHLSWENGLQRAFGHRERISTANSVISAISRRHLHGRAFSLDPDAFILRTPNQKMSQEQRVTLFRLNLALGGIAFMSDNPAEYSPDELALYRSHFPLREKKVLAAESRRGTWTIRLEIENREYVLLANLTPKRRDFRIEPGVYFDPDIPGLRHLEDIGAVEPFASKCLLKASECEWEVLGSTGHLFPGCEVDGSVEQDGQVKMSLHPQARYESEVLLRVPDHLDSCVVNGYNLGVEKACGLTYVRVTLKPAPLSGFCR